MLKFGLTAYQHNLRSEKKEELSVSFTRAWDEEYCESPLLLALLSRLFLS